MTENQRHAIAELAERAAKLAGNLLRDRWQEPRKLREKAYRDWVTDADFASQDLLIETISDVFPGHGFLTEEAAPGVPTEGDVIWVIDPIDGTSNYSRQQPNFCISLAAMEQQQVFAGAIYDPIRDEMFRATRGDGSYLNGKRMAVSQVADPARAIIALDWSHAPAARQETLEILQRMANHVHSIRAIGSAAMALAWLAAGRLDAYYNLSLKPWDFAAGTLLIELAGGQCRDLQGRPLTPSRGSCGCLASNGLVHDHFLEMMTAVKRAS